jgi:uncharacterized membrane protein
MQNSIAKLPLLASIVALGGLADAVYLTIHHYTKEEVPCGEAFDCGAVLTSSYAEIGGIPLAAFGALAYFTAFSLAILSAFGNRLTWRLFGLQVILMACFTAWLVYLQAFVIKAYCQFCLISAGITLTLLIIALVSKFWRVR